MQNLYVHNSGDWHLVDNIYVHDSGDWHLLQNAYIHYNGDWHLAYTQSNSLDETFEYAGDYVYTVPKGVFNIDITYPTTNGIATLIVTDVYPGQEIPIKIGEWGTTSTVTVNTSTYILPAYDQTVLYHKTFIDGWLDIKFSAATPSGTAVVSNTTNEGAQSTAAAAGAIWTVTYQGYQGDYPAEIKLTPVKSDTLINNFNNIRIIESFWSGRNKTKEAAPFLQASNGYYNYWYRQNDDPQKAAGQYIYAFNVQQILKVTVSPRAPITSTTSTLTLLPISIPPATVNNVYNVQFNVFGGFAPYTYSATGGPTINSSGILNYFPTSVGNVPITVTASDAFGNTDTNSYTLEVKNIGTETGGINIVTSFPVGTFNTAYTGSATATGGSTPYTWIVVSGSLPPGLTFTDGSPSCTISGTPTSSGVSTFTLRVTDGSEFPQSSEVSVSITIQASGAMTLSPSSLPSGTVGTAYSQSLSVSGGTAPYNWALSGSLPAGLTFNSVSGVISGTPTAAGTANFTITVNDSSNPIKTISRVYSITTVGATQSLTINQPATVSPFPGYYPLPYSPFIYWNNSPSGTADTLSYSFYNTATSYVGSQVITGNGGTQVSGLSISATTGTYTLVVTLDNAGLTASASGITVQ